MRFIWFGFVETESHCVNWTAQNSDVDQGAELVASLPLPPKGWGYRCAPPHLLYAEGFFFSLFPVFRECKCLGLLVPLIVRLNIVS